MVCNKRFFQLSEDWSLSVFEASVTRVSQSIGTIRVFLGSAEASQFWQKEESFFLFFFCCFCALLQTNSCEKRPLWTSMYLSYHKKAEKTYFWVTQLEYFQSTEMVGQKICQQKMTADWFLANKDAYSFKTTISQVSIVKMTWQWFSTWHFFASKRPMSCNDVS